MGIQKENQALRDSLAEMVKHSVPSNPLEFEAYTNAQRLLSNLDKS